MEEDVIEEEVEEEIEMVGLPEISDVVSMAE